MRIIQNMPKTSTVLYCTFLVSATALVHLILAATAAPTSPFTFFFNMYDKIHAAVFQKLVRTLTHIFEVCDAGSDDVDHAENAPGFRRMIVVVVVVVMRMGMRV